MQIGKGASILALGAAVACLAASMTATAGEAASGERTMLAGWMGMHRNMMQGMMGGSLPPGIDPARLPEPDSSGAHLLQQFCMQCHNLPGPGLHTAPEWPPVLGRMNMRMQMMGGMRGGMMGVAAPDPVQLKILLGYLQRNAQKPIDAAAYPDLDTPPGRTFGTTCMQCHALPDPKQHTAREWPSVVARMRGHMTAMGKILPDETTTDEIVDFLQRHSAAQK
jgi:cytochrome c2